MMGNFSRCLTSALIWSLLAVGSLAGTADATQPEPTPAVSARDYTFAPAYLTVAAGTTVTWTNADAELHTVTSDLDLFNLDVAPRATVALTFTEPGVYSYYCLPHDWMIGEITVIAPAEEASPSEG